MQATTWSVTALKHSRLHTDLEKIILEIVHNEYTATLKFLVIFIIDSLHDKRP